MGHDVALPYFQKQQSSFARLYPRGNRAPLAGTTIVNQADENGVAVIPNAVITRNDSVTYTIRYSNRGKTPLSGLVLNDVVPQFTTFVGQTNGPLPAGLTGPTFAQNGRFLKWTFGGTLAPGLGGFVTFTVKVTP